MPWKKNIAQFSIIHYFKYPAGNTYGNQILPAVKKMLIVWGFFKNILYAY